jgi:hypothetical protein
MDIKANTFDDHADELARSAQLLDQISEQITAKSIEIDEKIAVLLKKTNLKLEDATQFLTLQKIILGNELDYIKNVKTIISTSIKSQLLTLAENIAMFLVSIQAIYKEIPSVEVKHAQVSHKKDNISKIIGDINTNLNIVRGMLLEFDAFNRKFTEDISKGNFHCLTLSSDMRTVYTHIFLEYKKYVTDMDNRMEYYNGFATNILEQIPNMKICNFYLPPDAVAYVSTSAQDIASDLKSRKPSLMSDVPDDTVSGSESASSNGSSARIKSSRSSKVSRASKPKPTVPTSNSSTESIPRENVFNKDFGAV